MPLCSLSRELSWITVWRPSVLICSRNSDGTYVLKNNVIGGGLEAKMSLGKRQRSRHVSLKAFMADRLKLTIEENGKQTRLPADCKTSSAL